MPTPTLTILATFNGANGAIPQGSLYLDAAGDLLGTTAEGGTTKTASSTGDGTAFEIPLGPNGYATTPTTILDFNNANGNGPYAGLVADAQGNLYGTTEYGGSDNDGVIFEIAKTPAGYASTPTVLASFDGADGSNPVANLYIDAEGDLFGTDSGGGTNGDGGVFELPLIGGGGYVATPLAIVQFNGADGALPVAGLIADAQGDLFGTTDGPNASGGITVFEIAKTATGYSSSPTTLVSFNGKTGGGTDGALSMDANGDIFGTTQFGGPSQDGTVFEIKDMCGTYASTATTLATFNGADGAFPGGGVIVDANGDLFGTTFGNSHANDGTVFEIANTAQGYDPTPVVLATFNGVDGYGPYANLIADANGDLFGTDIGDTRDNAGTVFEVQNSGYVAGAATSESLPNVQPYFTSAVYSVVQSVIAAMTASCGTLNVPSVPAGGSAPPSVAGAINGFVVTTGGAGAASNVPQGYTLNYQFGSAATLADPNGGTALFGTVANATLIGAANDTIFGGDAGETLIATSGAESIYGGTGTDLIELGAATAQAYTQGTDVVVGSTQAETVNSAGSTTFFDASGSALFDATGGSATLVGGTGAETVQANAAPMEVFGTTGAFNYVAGSGTGTVVSGVGSSASITGGSTGLLYFGNGSSAYTPGTATDTILGFTGSLTATGGANGTLFFTGTAGNNVVSSGTGATTIFGFGAGDLLTATGTAPDVIAATAASETVDGTASSGSDLFFAFGQNDVVQAGSGSTAIETGLGNQTLIAGTGGTTLFDVLAGASRTLTIEGFSAGQDFVKLDGYGAGAAATALAAATVSGAGTTIALIDGTQITFAGVTNLAASSFF